MFADQQNAGPQYPPSLQTAATSGPSLTIHATDRPTTASYDSQVTRRRRVHQPDAEDQDLYRCKYGYETARLDNFKRHLERRSPGCIGGESLGSFTFKCNTSFGDVGEWADHRDTGERFPRFSKARVFYDLAPASYR
ncbi:uncharacterized protein PG986_004138 [Apiospora aurea]|uniref:Uncharacterized protein n=1 Tax=Apiospora aurea TaxID=335848 RepID=A0ABR1QLR0_9PEZI